MNDEERKARNREYNRIWRDKNREKYRQQQAEYRERHREVIRARHRGWVENNKERNKTQRSSGRTQTEKRSTLGRLNTGETILERKRLIALKDGRLNYNERHLGRI